MTKRFSERIGAREPPPIQMDFMTDDLRVALWNRICSLFRGGSQGGWPGLGKRLCLRLNWPVDAFENDIDLAMTGTPARGWVRNRFFKADWAGVYDILEILVELKPRNAQRGVERQFNVVLERERSGYRFIDSVLTPISNESEMAEVADAQQQADEAGWGGARQHLRQAVQMLDQRPEPDYRNAIKEAVSAVESACRHITGDDSATVGKALDAIDDATPIHGAMKEAFKKLYGYASDEDGIRHAMLDEPNVGFDEAKFMVVACSALVNYLASKAAV